MATLTFPSIIPNAISFGIKYSTQINISPLSGSVQTIEVPGARWLADLSYDQLEPAESRELIAFLTQLRGSSGRFYLSDFSHLNPLGSNLSAGLITVDVTQDTLLDSGTALGTHSTTTIEDTTADFIVDAVISVGDQIVNEVYGETRKIVSFTATEITVSSTWTQPLDTQAYSIYPAQTGNSIYSTGWDATQTGLLLPGDYIQLEGPELKIVTESVDSDGSGNALITFEPPLRVGPNNESTIETSNCVAPMLLSQDESRWSVDNAGLLANINITCIEGF